MIKKASNYMKSNSQNFMIDLIAGLTVSFAALALGAAFGVMSGRGAFAGMMGAAIIPIITSAFGGTRIQASGPTGPMTAVTAVLVAKAYDSFPERAMAEQFITLTVIISGLLMILCGLARTGRFIKFVPHAVILGFMNGIAALIWWDQTAKIFGLAGKAQLSGSPVVNIIVAFLVLLCIFLLPSLIKRVIRPKYRFLFSAVLLSIIIGSIACNLLQLNIAKVNLGMNIQSFSDFLSLLKAYFPQGEILQLSYIKMAMPTAIQLMVLGYIDSLLTALVIDKMTKEDTDQDRELIAQGMANGLAGMLQGIPGAQATIRSVLLVKEGAKTRMGGIFIGLFVICWIAFFIDWVSLIPAAVFTGVLFKAGWDVTDREFTSAYFKRGWWRLPHRNFQFILIFLTTILTVLFDLNVAVIAGTVLYYLAVRIFKKYKLRDVESNLDELVD